MAGPFLNGLVQDFRQSWQVLRHPASVSVQKFPAVIAQLPDEVIVVAVFLKNIR